MNKIVLPMLLAACFTITDAMNTEFPDNPQRLDPYANFKYQLKSGDTYIAAVSNVSGLADTNGSTLTLERGVTYDSEFEAWAHTVWGYAHSKQDASTKKLVAVKDFRKDIVLERYNEAGQKIVAYTIYNAWVSAYDALPSLDSSGNAEIIQSMKLENEGWHKETFTVSDPYTFSSD